MCLNQFLVDHVFQPDVFWTQEISFVGVLGLVDQVFKPETWKVDHVFKPSLA